ncbi:MAG TPA: Holliday junction resolvase-like protein [Anaerolineae bacterium]|nr:Holliday junction resolvase-like protein [Anaerolineae bacterium]
MDFLIGIFGLLVGAGLTYWLLRAQARAAAAESYADKSATEHARLAQRYEARIRELESRHAETVLLTRRDTADQSRAVLKGKMAEQIAPLLPGFKYWPADARFLGDPVDYVVFNGYSALTDGAGGGEELEVVILDIKRGARTTLSPGQRAIARAVEQGRVRFEVVRVFDDGTVRAHGWSALDPVK